MVDKATFQHEDATGSRRVIGAVAGSVFLKSAAHLIANHRNDEAVFAFLRRIGRQYDISPVLIGEVAVYDFINATSEMASRFDFCAVRRWQYGEEYLMLLDSLEAALPSKRVSDLSDERLARRIFNLSEGLIGETVAIVTKAVIAAINSGAERITKASLDELRYIPISQRRNATLRESLL